jgi:hypothetical protein
MAKTTTRQPAQPARTASPEEIAEEADRAVRARGVLGNRIPPKPESRLFQIESRMSTSIDSPTGTTAVKLVTPSEHDGSPWRPGMTTPTNEPLMGWITEELAMAQAERDAIRGLVGDLIDLVSRLAAPPPPPSRRQPLGALVSPPSRPRGARHLRLVFPPPVAQENPAGLPVAG